MDILRISETGIKKTCVKFGKEREAFAGAPQRIAILARGDSSL
jgi:hypothetical protein